MPRRTVSTGVWWLVSVTSSRPLILMLSGMGADELFAGYRKHYAALLAGRYRRLPGFLRRGLIEPLVRALPVAVGDEG